MSLKVFHLSHTDLDGYGAQYVASHFFKNITFYNSNYGREINERFNEIKADIKISEFKKNIILISDLNLTKDQCKIFEESLSGIDKNIKLLLLDHHQSGLECFEEFSWYFLDNERCATKIVFDFLSSVYNYENKKLSKFVSVVNAVDIWLSKESDFELGKVCLGLVASAKEINKTIFPKENSQYILFLLDEAQKYFMSENPEIALDNAIHKMKKSFFGKNKKDNTLSNLISLYIVDLLSENKERMTIFYKDYKGILTYNIGNVSVVGNDFLVRNEDYDFFLDVTSRKTLSFRANGKVDVSKISSHLVSGGGHPNASGGIFNSFKDSFVYDNIKSQFVNLIKSKQTVN